MLHFSHVTKAERIHVQVIFDAAATVVINLHTSQYTGHGNSIW